MRERIDRIGDALREIGADWAVLTSPDSVCYATGHAVPIEAGPSPFCGGPTTALVGRDGAVGLVAPNHELGAPPQVDRVEAYEGFTWDRPADQVANYRRSVIDLTRRLSVSGRLAIEQASFPKTLADLWPLETSPFDAALARARAIKTPDEVRRLRRAAEIAAIGQRAARSHAAEGRSELEIFARIRSAMERAAGGRCPLTGDFVTGIARTAGTAGWPIERILHPRDPVICDLAPRVDGYWGDSCGSFHLGRASARYLGMFAAAEAALATALTEIRPGLPVSRLDAMLRDVVRTSGFHYPHHSGHSIGTGVHEHPRIVPYETTIIEENMVLMVEPGAYVPDVGGVRLEFMLRVTATGAETMATFPMAPSLG